MTARPLGAGVGTPQVSPGGTCPLLTPWGGDILLSAAPLPSHACPLEAAAPAPRVLGVGWGASAPGKGDGGGGDTEDGQSWGQWQGPEHCPARASCTQGPQDPGHWSSRYRVGSPIYKVVSPSYRKCPPSYRVVSPQLKDSHQSLANEELWVPVCNSSSSCGVLALF